MKRCFVFLLVALLTFTSFPISSFADYNAADGGLLPSVNRFESATRFDPDLTDAISQKKSQDQATQKLSSNLLQLVSKMLTDHPSDQSDLIAQMTQQRQLVEMPSVFQTNGHALAYHAYVYIELDQGSDLNTLKPLVSQIRNKRPDSQTITAYVDLNMLEAVASLNSVRSIREVLPPVVYTGSMTSEGDEILTADMTRTLGADGTGVKVGIISDGVDSYLDAVSSGDLPADLTVLSNTVGGDEGTAMLEIVHDLAPGAELYFHDCGSNIYEFIAAIENLKTAGCNIICDDIGWIGEPFFEDGTIAEYVDNLLDTTDIIYVSSAGNAALSHFQGDFVDFGDGTADFSNGSDPSYPYLYANLKNGQSLTAVMQWNEAFGDSANDYDLYLFNYITGVKIGASEYEQNGDDAPLEYIQYTNTTGSDMDVVILANAYDAPVNKTLELYVYNVTPYSNNIVSSDSIFGHAAVPGVIACGAAGWSSPDVIESFSSRGPVTMLAETRQKPDITGADGVTITGAGGFGSFSNDYYYFYGTSAAAPHIAAVVALLDSRFTSYSPALLKQTLFENSTDLGSTGFDNAFGFGRADAYGAATSRFIVSLNSQDSSDIETQLVVRDGLVTKPAEPALAGYTFDGWHLDEEGTLPWDFEHDTVSEDLTLYAFWIPAPYTHGRGTEDSPYGVSTTDQLDAIRDHLDSNFILLNNLDLSADISEGESFWNDGAGWLPIGDETAAFIGGFNGDGFSISGLYINRPSQENIGLFGHVDGAFIEDITLLDVDIAAVSGGAIAGLSTGDMSNCHVTGSISGNSSSASVVGGIVGQMSGSLTLCSNQAAISGALAGGIAGTCEGTIAYCANHGHVNGLGTQSAGGIVGSTFGSINDCYNTGEITQTETAVKSGGISGWHGSTGTIYLNCYSAGQADFGITANAENTATATNCYYLDTSAADANSYGLALTDPELTGSTAYVGFDFNDIWTMDGELSYLYAELQAIAHPVSLPMLIESLSYTINRGTSLITGIPLNTSIALLKEDLINDPETIHVFTRDGLEYTGDTIASGMVVKLIIDDVVKDELTITILGDVSGDGAIDITDILYVRADILGSYNFGVYEFSAGDVSGDQIIDITDILYIRAHILGNYNIHG